MVDNNNNKIYSFDEFRLYVYDKLKNKLIDANFKKQIDIVDTLCIEMFSINSLKNIDLNSNLLKLCEKYNISIPNYEIQIEIEKKVKQKKRIYKGSDLPYFGLTKTKHNNYKVQINHNGVCVYLGTYKTKDEAGKRRNEYIKKNKLKSILTTFD